MRALGGRSEDALPAAAGLEMLHNAFLVHDDIEDSSDSRRGVPTMHRRVGVPIAVNTGDAMNALAMRLFRKTGERLGPAAAMRIFDEVDHMVVETLEGQAMELGWVRDNDLAVGADDYLRLVLKKTAWYSFIHPMRIGAIVANGDDRNLGRFDRFGYLLGLAFQITDDVLNLNGNVARYGKEINGDLWEGKRTLLLTHALGHANRADRAWISSFLARPRERRLPREVLRLHQIISDARRHPMGTTGRSRICGSRGPRVRHLGIRGRACKSRPRMAALLRRLSRTAGRLVTTVATGDVIARSMRTIHCRLQVSEGGAAMPAIREWLASLGLSEYTDTFIENRIDLPILPDLTDQDLKDLGVLLGDRRRILRAIAELARTTSATPQLTGTPESKPREEAERRQVTVMFADLVGSTALSVSMDPEDLREVISAYQKCVADTVRHFGGFVARYLGDGVKVYFGYPEAHEDDAERAVRAGLELTAAVAELKPRAFHQVRVGIATGLVVVGHLIPAGESEERGIVGETPNLASRLQGIAEPNMVVIAEGTRRLLGDLFKLQDLGRRDLKGIHGPVRTWAVLQANSVASRFEALHLTGLSALIGREEESALLLRRWERATKGEGQVVLLSGEAGIGKSRLTAAFMERLAGEPHTRLRYFCSPQHTDSPLHPIIGQMERAARLAHNDTVQMKLDKLDALLKQTSTSAQHAALIVDMLSLPNEGRYPALEADPAAAAGKHTGRAHLANGRPDPLPSSADGLRGRALGRPHEPGSCSVGR